MSHGCRRCYVSGRVQGVGFRASACQQGRSLGLRVRARNLSDGRVEVIAVGDEESLDSLCGWLRRGPTYARVVDVVCESLAPDRWPVEDCV